MTLRLSLAKKKRFSTSLPRPSSPTTTAATYVSTAGIGPANDEELDSICEIKQFHSFDQEYVFAPNSRQCILAEGRHLAKTWNL